MTKPKFQQCTRQVTPRFFQNAELADLEKSSGIPKLRLTMIGLWQLSDETGIFEWAPRVLAGYIYMWNAEDQATVEPAMLTMLEAGFLRRVEVEGTSYGYWPHWGAHNNFRTNTSRYPAVQALVNPDKGTPLLKTPRKGTSPLESPGNPLEREVEREVESETEREREVESEQESIPESMPAGKEIPAAEKLPVERLATLLFKLLDQPKDQLQNAAQWHRQVAALLRAKHSEEEIASVMDFAALQNDFSAEYLIIAKQPMASFVKNYDNLSKRWKAQQKGAAAAANRAKLETPTAPGAHGNVAREGKIQL
jgi:hypothetical protein